jgi:hypothetical protein
MPPAAILLASSSSLRTSPCDDVLEEKTDGAFSSEEMKDLEDVSLRDEVEAVNTIVAAANAACETAQRLEMERGECEDDIAKTNNVHGCLLRRLSSSASTWPESISESSSILKQVRFPLQRAVQVIETIHILDYTLEEMQATWYTKREMRVMKRERKELARLVDQGIMPEEILLGTGDDVRGIESATVSGNRIRHKHIVDGIDSVMVEQDMQYEDCKWNADTIAYIYHVACESSMREAHIRAIIDEQVVMEDLQQIRQEFASNVCTTLVHGHR